ncbi:MAG: metalloregulator ArsR/SmtB family transcription factor [Sphingomicrobium sp.]
MPRPDAARRFAALGDPHRLALVARLGDGGEWSISALGSDAAISRQALTKHLRVLEGAGLVRATRFGREVRFRLERQAIEESERFLALVTRQWDDALLRLKHQVERG